MTVKPPARSWPTPQSRLKTRLNSTSGLVEGERVALRPVTRATLGLLQAAGIFALVIHGDDPDAARPSVMFAYWIGAATPANGQDYDWWYTSNV